MAIFVPLRFISSSSGIASLAGTWASAALVWLVVMPLSLLAEAHIVYQPRRSHADGRGERRPVEISLRHVVHAQSGLGVKHGAGSGHRIGPGPMSPQALL